MKDLHDKVVATIREEDPDRNFFCRFRKISHRKNHTKRPNGVYDPSDYLKTLEELNLRRKQHIYLEQEETASKCYFILNICSFRSDFGGLDYPNSITTPTSVNDKILISVRVWNPHLRRPTSLRDFVVPQELTIRQLKDVFAASVNILAENMIIVEEETEKQVHLLLDDEKKLGDYR